MSNDVIRIQTAGSDIAIFRDGHPSEMTCAEVDRAAWFDLSEAQRKILPGQRRFLDDVRRLVSTLRDNSFLPARNDG